MPISFLREESNEGKYFKIKSNFCFKQSEIEHVFVLMLFNSSNPIARDKLKLNKKVGHTNSIIRQQALGRLRPISS